MDEKLIGEMFNRIAPRYDFLNRLLSMGQDIRWRKDLIAEIPTIPNGVLLDVATGTGDVLLSALKSHSEYSSFIGTDISQEMLNLAAIKSRKSAKNYATHFQIMSGEKLTFPSQSIHTLTIAFGLRNIIDKEKAISEFYRVLSNSNGTLLILEFFDPKPSFKKMFFTFYTNYILPKIGALFSDRAAYQYLPKSVKNFYMLDELIQKLNNLGFSAQVKKKYLGGYCSLIKATKNAPTP